jgi:hypothetical protein
MPGKGFLMPTGKEAGVGPKAIKLIVGFMGRSNFLF